MPISVPGRGKEAIKVERDEGLRHNVTLEELKALKTVQACGTVTAGKRVMPVSKMMVRRHASL